jgi:hypothetical protein
MSEIQADNKKWFPVGHDPKMLEHTPSTEVVRFTYTWFMGEDCYAANDEAGHDGSVAKFERWLAEVKEEAFKEGADFVNNQCSETNVGF